MPDPTLTATVEGVGSFIFRKRTLDLQLGIEGDAERLTHGPVRDKNLNDFAAAVSALRALTVTAPSGWDLDDLDPMDPDVYVKVLSVYRGLREAEKTFRAGAAAQRP